MAFEGLNQAGHTEKDLIVVLNDNEMSISPNVGAFSSFLSRKMSGRRFVNLRKEMENFLKSFPGVGENILNLFRKSEDSILTFFTPGMLFEAFKFRYIGPIRGHRLDRIIEALNNASHLEGPVLIHVLTQKGKGYGPAEKDPAHYHGVGSFEVSTGTPGKKVIEQPPTYTKVFGCTMIDLAKKDDKLFAITAAMLEGTGLDEFSKVYPDRFLDVGIAEQHAVTFAAGLATEGFRPVVAIYSTFLQRAFDQIIHDVCLQNLPVVFCLDRGGLVGEDGPTHHGQFDITYLRSLPNMCLMAPKDENENIPLGEAELIKEGNDLLIIALGSMVHPSKEAAAMLGDEGLSIGVVNCRFVKPLDRRLAEYAKAAGNILIVEENIVQGGLGSAILEMFNDMEMQNLCIKRIGIPDIFVKHGPLPLLREKCGLDTAGIAKAARALCNKDK